MNRSDSEFFVNSLGMKFRCIRVAGAVPMAVGSDRRLPNVGVVQSDFAIGVFLVTQQEYFSIVSDNPSYFKGEPIAYEDSSRFPVENISCADAVKFCRKLSSMSEEKRYQRIYRLPTEAEWEFAFLARGKDSRSVSDGPDLQDYGWIEGNSGDKTHPVGQKKPNPWGIYDMSGNVWEWCLDSEVPEITDRTDLTIEPFPNFDCSFRGGDFGCGVELCGTSKIHRVSSAYRGNFVGFRLVVDVS